MSIDEEKLHSEDNITMAQYPDIDTQNVRYPFCIVWTPIPFLTWLFPFIGHMGICTSNGVVRDFAGPYFVSEDHMAFGNPTKYWQLQPDKVPGGPASWDRAIADAADVYKGRMHNLCCDNCHSMVALALNNMKYNNGGGWNMHNLCCDNCHSMVALALNNMKYNNGGDWNMVNHSLCCDNFHSMVAFDLNSMKYNNEGGWNMHNLCCDNCHSMVAIALNNMKYNNEGGWNMHNLCCDNCHSMVALALNSMKYNNEGGWNMVNHNLCCDNCHSMVALALNNMKYNNEGGWNMVNVAFRSLIFSKYISVGAWLKTWLPFTVWISVLLVYILILNGKI
ncbi:hypothetical protein J6590_047939 [Homalodisca vitripennis]|nr:hypothetical protein J6590_047939 [Homalodisca vitripennis]